MNMAVLPEAKDAISPFGPVPDLPSLDRFTLPCGNVVLTTRALVKDSWLQWRDALPQEEELWDQLSAEAVHAIVELARCLHGMHRAMKGYKQCDESPFTVSRWWDPTADDDGYDSGRYCLMKFKDFAATDLIRAVPRTSALMLTPVSPRAPQWVEAWVQEKPVLPLTGCGLTAEVTSGARDS